MEYLNLITKLLSSLVILVSSNRRKIKLLSVEVVFNTLSGGKNRNTYLDVVLKRSDDIVIGERRSVRGLWKSHSTNRVAVPVRAIHFKKDITGVGLLLHISPNGKDKWEFDYIVIITWSDETRIEKEFRGNILSQDNPDLYVAL